ncbi:vegetative cell wall protein gp1-like [Rhopalosiphum maidis]|uniref:vegetative cell wall protein gp1-like n=1 Tax=Rhopalosiphum maidis TaxID=43146 RepID=UPI000EFE8194|nr:vegetative cell wall protein gp1-like [Rhopalosiphum maidis]
MEDCTKKTGAKKTVRFNPELQVVFAEQDEPDRVPGLANLSRPTLLQHGQVHRLGLLRRSRPRQQPRPPALLPKKSTDVLALINGLLDKPLEKSPTSSPPSSPSSVAPSSPSSIAPSSPTSSPPSSVAPSSPSSVAPSSPSSVAPSSPSSSPPPLLPKQQTLPKPKLLPKPKVLPEPQPRPRSKKPVSCRGKHRVRHVTIDDGPSGTDELPARSGFLKPLCVNHPVPPTMAPPPPVPPRMVPFPPVPRLPQPSTSSDATPMGNVTDGITVVTEYQNDKAGGSDGKHKGRCKPRDGRCKKCDGVANQSQGDDGDGSESDDHHGCGMRCVRFTVECMGCTIS